MCHFVDNKSYVVLIKPIDSEQWTEKKIIITAINSDTRQGHDYMYDVFGDITKIVDFTIIFCDSIENNESIKWNLDESN